jgi:hypothetical protein
MARKRKGLEGLDYQSKEYWSKLLTREGLSMERGRSARLTYLGDSSVLESVEGAKFTDMGRVPPKKNAE